MLSYLWPFKSNAENSVEEAINAENKGRILKYSKFLEYFRTEILDIRDFIEQSRKIYLAEIDELKSMNFTNLVLMLYSCCGPEFHDVITENENLHVLLEILNSMSRINNIASKKLALFIKFVDSRKSSKFSNHPLLESLDSEEFQASSWVPEMSFDEATQLGELLLKKYSNIKEFLEITNSVGRKTDIEKVHEAKLKADAYCSQLEMDHTFLQDVVQSFLPLENMTNALDRFLLQAGERSASINELLQQRAGEETYHILEKNYIERYNKRVNTGRIEAQIDLAANQEQLETIKGEILPLVSNIEEDYQFLIDLLKHENIEESPNHTVMHIFKWSQRIKKQIDELSGAFGEVEPENRHSQLSTEGQTHQQSSKETYQALERNFIERYNKQVEKGEIEARIDSATDQKQLQNFALEILPLILKIEEDYQVLIDLSNQGSFVKSPTVKRIFECSQRIKDQINDLSKAFSEGEPKIDHFQSSALAQTRQQRPGKETYQVSDNNFIEKYDKQEDKGRTVTVTDSCTDQKQLETITVKILPLVSNIEAYYQMLIDLLKHANIENIQTNGTLMQILEWSQRIKKQIEDLLALPTATFQRSYSDNKMPYSDGFLKFA